MELADAADGDEGAEDGTNEADVGERLTEDVRECARDFEDRCLLCVPFGDETGWVGCSTKSIELCEGTNQ